jgi:hypothetical protein
MLSSRLLDHSQLGTLRRGFNSDPHSLSGICRSGGISGGSGSCSGISSSANDNSGCGSCRGAREVGLTVLAILNDKLVIIQAS